MADALADIDWHFARKWTLTLILATQRSGSTLLCEELARHSRLGKPNEYFLRLVQRKTVPLSQAAVEGLFLAGRQGKWPKTALKLMYNQLHPLADWLGWDANPEGKPLPEHMVVPALLNGLAERFGRLNLIHMEREDVREQAFSVYRARATGEYRQPVEVGSTPVPSTPVDGGDSFNVGRFLELLVQARRERGALRTALERSRLPYSVLTYRQLVDHYPGCLKRVLRELNEGFLPREATARPLAKVVGQAEFEQAMKAVRAYFQ
ncbi:MAG: Stf0 family sulfotransferase [Opitutales bacterium]